MKITETTQGKGGERIEREFHLELRKGLPRVCHLLIPDEEPFAVKIIRSGWTDMYHVIHEWGDTGNSDYEMIHISELLQRFPEYQETLDELFPDVIVTTEEFLEHSNDRDLGSSIRKKSIDIYNSRRPSNQLEIPF